MVVGQAVHRSSGRPPLSCGDSPQSGNGIHSHIEEPSAEEVKAPTVGPQIVILGVAGSSPVSHPFGSFSACLADIRLGEPNDEYHRDLVWRNCSRAKTFLESIPLYYGQHVAGTVQPSSSDAMDHGTLLHSILENGPAILDGYAVPPDSKLTPTKLVGKEAKQWALENHGPDAPIVAPKLMAQVRAEWAAIRANAAAAELVDTCAEHEASVRWTDAAGNKLRCKFDMVTDGGVVVDLKSTREADIQADWWKAVLKYRYHLSEAWYRRGAIAAGLEPRPLQYIVLSTEPPHDCQVVTLPEALAEEGARLMDRALSELRLREDLDWWMPDHHGEVIELSFPAHILRGMSQ